MEFISHIKFWISGSDSGWKFSAGGCSDGDNDHTGSESVPDHTGLFSGRSSSRNLYRIDPCQRKGQGSPLRYHYDDCAVDDQSQDCRESKCSDFGEENIFDNETMNGIFSGGAAKYKVLAVVLILAVIVKIILDLYLQTKSGFLLRAVGDNANLVTSLAKDQGNVKILGLAIANGMVAMAGGIFCQEQRVFEISSGTGAIVIGLASVIIGTSLFKNLTFLKATTAVLIGSVVYKACVAVALKFLNHRI